MLKLVVSVSKKELNKTMSSSISSSTSPKGKNSVTNDFWSKILKISSTKTESSTSRGGQVDESDDAVVVNPREDLSSNPMNTSSNRISTNGLMNSQSSLQSFASSCNDDKTTTSSTAIVTNGNTTILKQNVNDEDKKETQFTFSSFTTIAKLIGGISSSDSKSEIVISESNDELDKLEHYKKLLVEEEEKQDLVPIKKDDQKVEKQETISKVTSESIGSKLLQLLGNKKKDPVADIYDIVSQFRQRTVDKNAEIGASNDDDDDDNDPNSILEIMDLFKQYKHKMNEVANKYVGNVDWKRLTPTALFYYIEREDEVKNPSYKRRQHRFNSSSIEFKQIQKLNHACDIAELSYADTVEEIRTGLLFQNDMAGSTKANPGDDGKVQPRIHYELLNADLRSEPGKPANFVAIKLDTDRNTKKKRTSIDIIIVVRGTKTAADAFTDLLCDSEPYNGGKAHSFIVTSGIYIADLHHQLLIDLLEKTQVQQINVTFIGHSLGAGAASIAGMEFNNKKSLFYNKKIVANVIGFGCPALVTEELAKQSSSYITTVINDSDLVPRLSGISFANMLHKVLEFDWRVYAKKDLECTLKELERAQPILFRSTGTSKAIQSVVENLLNKYGKDLIVTRNLDDPNDIRCMPVELFPPGKCLHLYNDGRGISAHFVANTFFNEIDVTRRMIDDHLFFSGYQLSFLAIARQHTRNHHFKFEQMNIEH